MRSYFLTLSHTTHIHSTLLLIHLPAIPLCLSLPPFIPNLSFIHHYSPPPALPGPTCLCLVTHLPRQKSLMYCSGFSLAAHTNTTLNTNSFKRMEGDSSLGGLEWQLQAHQRAGCSYAVALPNSPATSWSKMIAHHWQHFHSFEKMYLKSSFNDSPARWGWPLGWSVTSCRFCGGTSYLSAFHTPSPSYLLLRPLNEFVPVGTDGRGCPGQRVGILAPQQKIWFHIACGYAL